MAVEHRVEKNVNLSSRLVTSEISRYVRGLMITINTELASRSWEIIVLGYEPSEKEWHYCVLISYDELDYPIIREVVEKHTNGKVIEFMRGKEVGL